MQKLQKKIQILLNLYKLKKLDEAGNFAQNLINENPNIVFLYNILGLILSEQEKLNEAIKCYEEGIKIDPNYAMIYNNLGIIYKNKEKYEIAESYYKKSIKLDSKIYEPCNNLANLYFFQNRYQDGIFFYNKAVKLNSKFFGAHYNLGIAYKTIGKIEHAKKHLEESIKLNPNFYSGHRNLSLMTKYNKENNHFKVLKRIYENTKIDNLQKTELFFALGKAYEDMKDFKKAFKYYSEGNHLKRKKINFSITNEKNEFNNIKKFFNNKFLKKYEKSGYTDNRAIFILGMPRSGTTLIEQILSSHPEVFGGDELDYLQNLAKKYFYRNEIPFSKTIEDINKVGIKKIGQEYIDKLKILSNNSERVTDKLPVNFKLIGMIKLILPNSKIIHCTRNSKDICLSIFKNYFTNPNLNFAYNLDEIVKYFILYKDLMSHWKNVLGDFVIEAEYEKIIFNPEKEIRNLLKKCNLSWNKNCLKFYMNQRAIKTASDLQVRKKFYKSSINSWKFYKKDLSNFFYKLPN